MEFNVGQAQYELGNLDRAKVLFQEVIEKYNQRSEWEDRVSANVALATTLYAQGNRDRGVQLIVEFLKASRENRTSWPSRDSYFWSDRLKADAEQLLAFLIPTIIIRNNYGSGKVLFSPDSKLIAGGEKIKLWDAKTGAELRTISESNLVRDIAWSPDGKILANIRDLKIIFWDPNNGKKIGEIDTSNRQRQTTTMTSLAFSPDGKIIASAHHGHSDRLDCIILWDINTGQVIRTFTGHPEVRSISWSPNGQIIASGSWDHTIKLWDAKTGQELHLLTGHSDKVASVAFSPDGQIIASGSWDHTIKLWDRNTGQKKYTLTGHEARVYTVAFSPNGQVIASGSQDETIRFWDPRTGEELLYLFKANGIVQSLDFNHDGSSLVNSSYQNAIEIWQVRE